MVKEITKGFPDPFSTVKKFDKLSVIIPVYNEENTIEAIIKKVLDVPLCGMAKEIVVIDDGSTDRTREILSGMNHIKAVFHERNIGKGGAIKTGIARSTGDILLLQDADCEYNPEDYAILLGPLLAGDTEFVMGSRFLRSRPRFLTKNGDPFFTHYIGNRMIIWLTNFLYGQTNTDYEGGYKVFTKSLAQSVPVQADGFEFDNELICKCLRRGRNIIEVPIRYQPRLYGEGKKVTWRDGLMMLWTIVKWRFASF